MVEFVVVNARLIEPGEGSTLGWVFVSDGIIYAMGKGKVQGDGPVNSIDAGGKRLTPGLIDMHTFGE